MISALGRWLSGSLQHSTLGPRRWIERHPSLFQPVYARLGAAPHQLARPTTDLLIEGFPRSGNTFAQVAVSMAQRRPIEIAGHTHSPGNVLLGIKLRRPVCVLIRQPEAALRSLMVRSPGPGLAFHLRCYATFYEALLPARPGLVVARFSQVTSDLGGVVQRVNERFGAALVPFDHSEVNLAKVSLYLQQRSAGRSMGFGYMPDSRRDALKARVRVQRHPRLLARCQRVFHAMTQQS